MKLRNVRFIQEGRLIQMQCHGRETSRAIDVIRTALILNKCRELVRQPLGGEAKLAVCRLSVHLRVRFCANSLCLHIVRKKEGEKTQSHELNEASAWQGV